MPPSQPAAKPVYGNYHGYHARRFGRGKADPRLAVLPRALFRDRTWLDIGCNAGSLTLAAARALAPRSVLAVDIDPTLIDTARRAAFAEAKGIMRRAWEASRTGEAPVPATQNDSLSTETGMDCGTDAEPDTQQTPSLPWIPRVFARDHGPVEGKALGLGARRRLRDPRRYPGNVNFVASDVLHSSHSALTGSRYGVVTCLSVTKWVHLNWGDAGIRTLFARLSSLVEPGGWLVIEPQPRRTYAQCRPAWSEVMRENERGLELDPGTFGDMLVATYGFERCSEDQVAGPDRGDGDGDGDNSSNMDAAADGDNVDVDHVVDADDTTDNGTGQAAAATHTTGPAGRPFLVLRRRAGAGSIK
jgi:7SK snRNA methylphosphate capping enzyme